MNDSDNLSIVSKDIIIEVVEEGRQGIQGPAGPVGPGVPNGGSRRQLLVKQSDADQDTDWETLASLLMVSTDSISINTNPSNPSFLTGLTEIVPSVGLEYDASTMAVRNVTGRVIPAVTGTISFFPSRGGGGSVVMDLLSERSEDNGVTWQVNDFSLRPVEIDKDNQSFTTVISVAVNWQPNVLMRFRAYLSTGSGLTLEAPGKTVLGQTISAPSIGWEISELPL